MAWIKTRAFALPTGKVIVDALKEKPGILERRSLIENIQNKIQGFIQQPGDNVAVVRSWLPPDAFDDMSFSKINQVLDMVAMVAKGETDDKKAYVRTRKGGGKCVGYTIQQVFPDKADVACGRIVKTWLDKGALLNGKARNSKQADAISVGERPDPIHNEA